MPVSRRRSLGKPSGRSGFYDNLLTMPGADTSEFRCDGYYARGVALESLGKSSRAIESYRQFLQGCADDGGAVAEVRSRMGDLHIAAQDYAAAIAVLTPLAEQQPSPGGGQSGADQSGVGKSEVADALMRLAYARFASGDLPAAVESYESLLRRFPGNELAAAAEMASGQAAYRLGQTELAAERFTGVIERDDLPASTEAAHWLARIRLAAGRPLEAEAIAREQLKRLDEADSSPTAGGNSTADANAAAGVNAATPVQYRDRLRFDLAQAVAADPARVNQSVELFMAAADAAPGSSLAARSIYNAAFSAATAGQHPLAIELVDRF